MKRSKSELIFIMLFFPFIIGFYLIYKYPTWFVRADEVEQYFYWFGKSTSFWYSTAYTALVASICIRVLIKKKTPYGKNKRKEISSYQKKKFTSILISQTVFFYFIPYFLPIITKGAKFFGDAYHPINKNAYVYVYNGFTSLGGFIYIFVLVPLVVWFFGKRYCSWFCACGNLSETVGVTTWGNKWVTQRTPRGKTASKFEFIQYIFVFLAICFGMILFLDTWKIVTAGDLLQSWRAFQDLIVDLIFGGLIGVGAYPFLGTRIWCRYGCPLAGGMRLFGKFSKSKFKVEANGNCKGLNLCTTQCPMGIDVASYAHKDGTPIEGSFGLN
jgi:ferredoxin-type protein NapH